MLDSLLISHTRCWSSLCSPHHQVTSRYPLARPKLQSTDHNSRYEPPTAFAMIIGSSFLRGTMEEECRLSAICYTISVTGIDNAAETHPQVLKSFGHWQAPDTRIPALYLGIPNRSIPLRTLNRADSGPTSKFWPWAMVSRACRPDWWYYIAQLKVPRNRVIVNIRGGGKIRYVFERDTQMSESIFVVVYVRIGW